jgi:hypothetical protein
MTRITSTLHEDQYAFLIIAHSVLLRRESIIEKLQRKIKTFYVQLIYLSENRAAYEIIWINIAEPNRPKTTLWRARITCWVSKASVTHSEHVVLIAFPRQQQFRERAQMWRYRCTACLVFFLARQPLVGKDLLVFQDLKSHADTPPLVGLLWTSDQPVTETSEIFELQKKKTARKLVNLNREEGEGIDFYATHTHTHTYLYIYNYRSTQILQRCNSQQVSILRATNIRRHCAKFSHHSDQAPGSFASMC